MQARGKIMNKYYFFHGDISEVVFLKQYQSLFDSPVCSFYINPDDHMSLRKEFDGLITLVGKVNGQEVGLIACDFKIYGGSFGVESSDRVCAFLREMKRRKIPVMFFLETIGVRIMEGRKVFPHAFSILRELKEFVQDNLFMTAAVGSCLGLGALIFEIGDYRFGIKSKSTLNLTGPEVFKMFFGKTVDFEKMASVEKQQHISALVHENVEDKQEVMERMREILSYQNVGAEQVLDYPLEESYVFAN
ncbi:MAG: hypothetical protein EP326_10310 [Deltaproteobacteria bacterium]|nr:MAG: hypothetical protein EP326_10310 [Deltaproteobacteria bacterium]